MKLIFLTLFTLLFNLHAAIEQRGLSFSKYDFASGLTSEYTDVFTITLNSFDELQSGMVKLSIYSVDAASLNVKILVDNMVLNERKGVLSDQSVGFTLPSGCRGSVFQLQFSVNTGFISYVFFQINSAAAYSSLSVVNYTPNLSTTYQDVYKVTLGPSDEGVVAALTIYDFVDLDAVNMQILVDSKFIVSKKPMVSGDSIQFRIPFGSNGKPFQLQMASTNKQKKGTCLFQITTIKF